MTRRFTRKVKRLAFDRCGGRCEGRLDDGARCAVTLATGRIIYDHRIPWEISRDSSLVNCQVLWREGYEA
jgi:5-methylcytosine-specific restriction enzyme A